MNPAEKSLPQITEKLKQRFWKRVEKQAGDACWLWTGTKEPKGYGFFVFKYQHIRVHRLSWELHFGPIPNGLCVCHNCPGGDQRHCVRPSHLWLGSYSDNNADCLRKGRNAFGERTGGAKLTKANIHEIRQMAAEGVTRRNIAACFNVAHGTINCVVNQRTWRHVKDE